MHLEISSRPRRTYRMHTKLSFCIAIHSAVFDAEIFEIRETSKNFFWPLIRFCLAVNLLPVAQCEAVLTNCVRSTLIGKFTTTLQWTLYTNPSCQSTLNRAMHYIYYASGKTNFLIESQPFLLRVAYIDYNFPTLPSAPVA
jgi:hypothetical protein